MAKIFKSKFKLVKRYARFSNTCVYFSDARRKKVRYGYKVYQKVFRRYRTKRAIRVNVRKPRLVLKKKSKFGKALEIKEKITYVVGGIRANRIKRYVKISMTKVRSPIRVLLKIIESRLDIIVYRINLVQTPKLIKKLIRYGYVEVNGKAKNNVNFRVKSGSKIDINFPGYAVKKYEINFAESIRRKVLFKPSNEYLEMSYITFRAIIHAVPDESTTFYPFNFNPYYLYRIYLGS
jgi:ribosomal protein S4